MPKFRYQITNLDGVQEQGEIEALDARRATLQLEESGAVVVSLEMVEETVEAVPEASPKRKPPTILRDQDFLDLSEQIVQLTEAGVPLASGLKALSEELPAGKLRRSLGRISARLEQGEDLRLVLSEHNAPPDLLAVLHAALRSGQLSLVLGQYVAHRKRISALRSQIALGFGYPLVLFSGAFTIFVIFSLYFVSEFEKMFADFGTELPAMTQLLIWWSRLLREVGIWMFVGVVVVAVITWAVYRIVLDPADRERLKFSLPLIGPILKAAAISRFLQLLSLLLEKQTPLAMGIELAGSGAGNPEVERSAHRLASSVRAGEDIVSFPYKKVCFPPALVRFIADVGPQPHFGEMIGAMATTYETRSRVRATMLAVMSEPVIIVSSALFLGFLVISLFLPLVKITNSLS